MPRATLRNACSGITTGPTRRLDVLCQWSDRRIFWTLVASYILFLESTSLISSDISQCLVSKIGETCPSLHAFLFNEVSILLDRILAHDLPTILGTIVVLFVTWELTAWFCRKPLERHDNRHVDLPSFFRLKSIDRFTLLLVIVGSLQWLTLEKTDETLKAQQRAWIEPGVPLIRGPFDEKSPIHLLIRYRNIGKEPAINAVIALDEPLLVVDPPPNGNWYASLPGKNPVCKRALPNGNGIVIYPTTASNEFSAHVFPNQPLADANMVFAQTKILVVEGCIGYQTVGKPYYAGFCYYWTPVLGKPPDQWGITKCQTRNEAF